MKKKARILRNYTHSNMSIASRQLLYNLFGLARRRNENRSI